jgi:hypothetical protein
MKAAMSAVSKSLFPPARPDPAERNSRPETWYIPYSGYFHLTIMSPTGYNSISSLVNIAESNRSCGSW